MRFEAFLVSVVCAVHQIDASTISGCSDAQAEMIDEAASLASNYAIESWQYLDSIQSSTPRYAIWFGNFTYGRAKFVGERFYFIYTKGISDLRYNCTCFDPDLYGYTFADSIYLCGAFWRAPMNGTNSKAGTLIRHASHFPFGDFVGTAEITSGPRSQAGELALFDPDAAISNAASLQYFAENSDPTQP